MLKVEFEGTDGAGKTTGLKYFIEKARAVGLTVVETREVGNPHIPICTKLRDLVLDPGSNLSGMAMEFIFSAMRIENDLWLDQLLHSGAPPDLVVSDRGWLSHLAYTDHNVSRLFTRQLYYDVVSYYTSKPNVVIYFNVDEAIALSRRSTRGTMDVIEQKGTEYQQLVRKSFVEHMDRLTGVSLREVDANQSLESVKQQLDNILLEFLPTIVNNQ